MKDTVLHVIDSLRVGGTERQLIQILRNAGRSPFRHQVCLIRDPKLAPGQPLDAGIKVHSLGLATDNEILVGIYRLRTLISRLQPDIIHTRLYLATIIGRVAGRLTGRPVVTTLVNRAYALDWRAADSTLRGWKVAVAHAIDTATAPWTTQHVAISDSVRRSAMEQLRIPADRISVIHRGIDANELPRLSADTVSAVRHSLGWPDADPLILNVGRLVPPKGQRHLIDAMRHVVSVLPRARLAIAGEGRLRESLTKQIRSGGLEGRVRLLGERSDIAALLGAADIFVFPSLSEGFGVALLEAMAAGLPCIAANTETTREVAGAEGVLLVTPYSAEALAHAIVSVASNPDLRTSLIAHARRRAGLFDLRTQERKLEALYASLLSRAPAPVPVGAGQPPAHASSTRQAEDRSTYGL